MDPWSSAKVLYFPRIAVPSLATASRDPAAERRDSCHTQAETAHVPRQPPEERAYERPGVCPSKRLKSAVASSDSTNTHTHTLTPTACTLCLMLLLTAASAAAAASLAASPAAAEHV